jgi:hypothetical protein
VKVATEGVAFIKFKTDPTWSVDFIKDGGWFSLRLAVGHIVSGRKPSTETRKRWMALEDMRIISLEFWEDINFLEFTSTSTGLMGILVTKVEEQSFDRFHLQESIIRISKTVPELEQARVKATSTQKQYVENSKAISQSLCDIIMILEKFHKGKAMNQAKEPMRPEPKNILPRGIGQGDNIHLGKEKSQIDVEAVISSKLLKKRTGEKTKEGKKIMITFFKKYKELWYYNQHGREKKKLMSFPIMMRFCSEEMSTGKMSESTEDEIESTEDDNNSNSGESENSIPMMIF